MTPRALITGAPRSGTGYIAQVLRESGVDVGHEAWWGIGEQRPVEIDVSWLGCFDYGFDGPIYAQVRDPRVAIPSIAAAYDVHPWRLVLAQNVTLTGEPMMDAANIWHTYTREAIRRARAWWRVEDVTADDLAWTGADCTKALKATPHNVNTRPSGDHEWPNHPAIDAAFDYAHELGYQ